MSAAWHEEGHSLDQIPDDNPSEFLPLIRKEKNKIRRHNKSRQALFTSRLLKKPRVSTSTLPNLGLKSLFKNFSTTFSILNLTLSRYYAARNALF